MKTYVEYQKLINKNLKQLASTKYKFLVPVFKEQNLEFLVKFNEQPYLEVMTNLTSSALLNTFELLEAKTSKQITLLAKPYFKSINQQFTNSFNQLMKMLDQAKNYVQDIALYVDQLEDWKIKVYQDFFDLTKFFLGNKVLPKFLQLYFNFDGEVIDDDFFDQQIEQFFFNFKSELNSKTDYLLKNFLTQIYEQYGLKLINYDQVNDEQKTAFSDFQINDFEPVVDLNTALMLFDLPKETTFSQIQKVYKQLAKMYHPDTKSNLANQEIMEQVNLAYQILKAEYQK